jgi:hypothetical protein
VKYLVKWYTIELVGEIALGEISYIYFCHNSAFLQIAIYNFERDAHPGHGDRIVLEFRHESGGIVRLESATLTQSAKRIKVPILGLCALRPFLHGVARRTARIDRHFGREASHY